MNVVVCSCMGFIIRQDTAVISRKEMNTQLMFNIKDNVRRKKQWWFRIFRNAKGRKVNSGAGTLLKHDWGECFVAATQLTEYNDFLTCFISLSDTKVSFVSPFIAYKYTKNDRIVLFTDLSDTTKSQQNSVYSLSLSLFLSSL